jgi:hypothetical protein
VDLVGEQRQRRELAGFLLPGILHEFRNLLSRINLLTEMPPERVPLSEIRQEIHSPDFAFLSDLMRSLTCTADEMAIPRPPSLELGTYAAPGNLDTLFGVLRSAARKLGVQLRVQDMSSIKLSGSGIDDSSQLCRAVYEVCDRSNPPKELSASTGTDPKTGASAIILALETGEAIAVVIGT